MNDLREGALFINYRTDDSKDFARRLERALEDAFPLQNLVFRDERDIRLTEDWMARLEEALNRAELLLSVIGPDWMKSFEAKAQNPDSEEIHDWVSHEIRYALAHGIDVVPVLLPNTQLPKPDKAPAFFPEDLYPLLTRQSFTIKKNQEREGFDEIIASLTYLFYPKWESELNGKNFARLELLAALPLPDSYTAKLWGKDEVSGKPLITAPYLGPTYFDSDHAVLFHGRKREIRRLFHQIRVHRLCLLDGYSGSGKSSLLHAGLMPRMKKLDTWQVFEPIRRNRQAGGMHRQVAAWLEKQEMPEGKRCLLILDQLEEMFTDPLPQEAAEMKELGNTLKALLKDCLQLHIVLAFRSEYLQRIQYDFLGTYVSEVYPQWGGIHLSSLSSEGVQEAILGPAHSRFRQKFNLHITEACAKEIARDFVGDSISPYGILLQIQMLQLWKEGQKKRKSGSKAVHISTELYQKHKQGDLEEFIEDKLQEIEEAYPWGYRVGKGLGLDVLHFFSTEEGTATSLADRDFAAAYAHIPDLDSPELLAAFKRVYLLNEAGLEEDHTRLSHDTIARIVRRKYLNSDACAQRAWRIVETRQRELQQNFQHISFSESDIASLNEGKENMRCIPPEIEGIREQDARRYITQRQARFDFAWEGAQKSLESLEFAEALAQLQIAWRERIQPEMLTKLAWELLYPFLELDQAQACWECLTLIWELQDPLPGLDVLCKQAPDIPALREYVQKHKPKWVEEQENRYYPTLIPVEGGTYQMGTNDPLFDHEGPAHEVRVDNFGLGETPVTFFQYGLYCLLTDTRIPSDSGFGMGVRPVINVSWLDAIRYCNWLSERKGYSSVYSEIGEKDAQANWDHTGYRLPTEAEWEYAAREGGKDIRFGNGKDHARVEEINFDGAYPDNSHERVKDYISMGPSRRKTSPIKSFPPNALGLYGMSGNVYDWCWDWYDARYYQAADNGENPRGPDSSPESKKAIRGGSWYNPGYAARCVFRDLDDPRSSNYITGFRVAGYFSF